MGKIVGIRFKPAGKIYHFDAGAFVLKKGDHVIVETEQGLGLGFVAAEPTGEEAPAAPPLKKVFRLATEEDFLQLEKNAETEKKAHAQCLQLIHELGLQMNLFSVQSAFDAGKLTFFFTAEGRVDFRQLVKMLVRQLGARVEMRQVGIRNQAKMLGGIGRCGKEICCSMFLDKFDPVSIRMAKEQGLSLNPTKISGLCGRLMCCLCFENQTYMELRKKFPKIGRMITTARGEGKVTRHNVIGNRVAIRLEDATEIEVGLEEIIIEDEKSSNPSPQTTQSPQA